MAKKVVVVTGASAGVGRATVRAFANRGADVGLLARGIDGLEGARREVEAAGGRAVVVPIDVAHADQIEAAADRDERELGPIDVWVNNAMVSVFQPVRELTADDIHRVTEVTYLGVVDGTLAALKRMVPRGRYLARTGYDAQQTDRPADPNRRDNLWDPLPGDRGAHGRFTSRSIESSPQTWLNEHLPLAVAVMFGGATIALAARFVFARR